MIGGGQYTSFFGVEHFDEELIVRSAQVHALMPMMQFSVAPGASFRPRIRPSAPATRSCTASSAPYILSQARHAAETGEPIVRAMEYAFPHMGFLECRDQFMLGDRYLVAPMVSPGTRREVLLPPGTWRDDRGEVFRVPKSPAASQSTCRSTGPPLRTHPIGAGMKKSLHSLLQRRDFSIAGKGTLLVERRQPDVAELQRTALALQGQIAARIRTRTLVLQHPVDADRDAVAPALDIGLVPLAGRAFRARPGF